MCQVWAKFVYNADYVEDGDYSDNNIGIEPNGKQWKKINLAYDKMGCIMPLKKLLLMPQKELDGIKCN
ncbi:MAG: hypothetical protein K0R14_195 [Burkholderiales bacterium]|nr:hypothetical protein [Burkholderiales bacterium]